MWNSVTGLAQSLACCLPRLFQSHGVRAGVALLAPEGAQPAAGHADIGGVDVPVDVEVGDVAVHPLAHCVRHPSDGQNVAAAIERDAVLEAQPLARRDLLGDRLQRRIVASRNSVCGE